MKTRQYLWSTRGRDQRARWNRDARERKLGYGVVMGMRSLLCFEGGCARSAGRVESFGCRVLGVGSCVLVRYRVGYVYVSACIYVCINTCECVSKGPSSPSNTQHD